MAMEEFFGWGRMDIEDEIQADVQAVLEQEKGALFYDREYGSGIGDLEGSVASTMVQVGGRFSAANALAERNRRVSDGSGDAPDRRVATSQGVIRVDQGTNGDVNVMCFYVPLINTRRPRRASTPVGGY